MSKSPYQHIEKRAFWRLAVERRKQFTDTVLFEPTFAVTLETKVATGGSCFAQHVGRALSDCGLHVIDAERAPQGTPLKIAQEFGYSIYSARYGNIYTAAHLYQLLREAMKLFEPEDPVWKLGERFVDAQRPSVEPKGLDSPELVLWHREQHLPKIVDILRDCDLFVFTFGLTEAWRHKSSGTVFSLAPGTLGGDYDSNEHEFYNYSVEEVVEDFRGFMRLARELNPDLKFLITVSPIPLAATASGEHVEVATVRSKSVLRAACDILSKTETGIDYFPSYEVITSPWSRGRFFASNLRDVTPQGIATVMSVMRKSYGLSVSSEPVLEVPKNQPDIDEEESDVRCEEVLLNQFADVSEDRN